MTRRSDTDILKGFLEGDSAAFAELLTRLRSAVLLELNRHHGGLRHAFDEIVDAAETRLFEWRKRTLAGEGQIDPDESILSLGARLAKQEARSEGRYLQRQRAAVKKEIERRGEGRPQQPRTREGGELGEEEDEWEEAARESANDGLNARELHEQLDSLPEEMRQVLIGEAQHQLAGGPPLHAQLGLTPEAARKRLERARRALREKLEGSED